MEEQHDEGFAGLKSGFQFSIIANILFALFIICFYLIPSFWLIYLVILSFSLISYIVAIYERARGWHSLNQIMISVIIVLGSLAILLSPTMYLLVFSFWIYLWLLPTIWGAYTIFESYGLWKLKQTYNVRSAISIICNLLGVSVLGLVEFVILKMFQLNYILASFIFASPFLIVSSIFMISELKKSSQHYDIVSKKRAKLLSEAYKVKIPLVAATLQVILACISLFMSIYYLIAIIFVMGGLAAYSTLAILVVFGAGTSIFGLIGGIFTFQKKRFLLASLGPFLIVCWYIFIAWFAGLSAFVIFTILFSIVNLTLLSASKNEFT